MANVQLGVKITGDASDLKRAFQEAITLSTNFSNNLNKSVGMSISRAFKVDGVRKFGQETTGILGSLSGVARDLKKELANATSVEQMQGVGSSLAAVTAQMNTYTTAAIKGSEAFKASQIQSVLNGLDTKLAVVNGNVDLFGNTLKTSQQELNAYQSALNGLLKAGLNPLDEEVVKVAANIDRLTASINASKSSSGSSGLSAQFKATGAIIPDLESKIKRLQIALAGATNERSIVKYNIRLNEAQRELERLNKLGISTVKTNNQLGNSINSIANSTNKWSGASGQVSAEFARIIQDAPYAANNFGSVGNNITQLVSNFQALQVQMAASSGVAVSTSAVIKAAFASMITPLGLVTIGISAVVSAFTFWQMYSQKVQRENNDTTASFGGLATAQAQFNNALENGDYQKAIADINTLRINVDLARRGMLAKKDVVDQYNESIGKTAGQVRTLDEVETFLVSKSDAYVKAMLYKSAATLALQDAAKKAYAAQLELNKSDAESVDFFASGLANSNDPKTLALFKKNAARNRKEVADEYTKDEQSLVKIARDFQTKAAQIGKQFNFDLFGNQGNKNRSAASNTENAIEKALQSANDSSNLAGLLGNDADIEKVRQKYQKLFSDIATYVAAQAKKGVDVTNDANKARLQLEAAQSNEIMQIILEDRKNTESEIQRIRNESGVKSAEGREKELAEIKKWYDAEVEKANGNASVLIAIEEGKQTRIASVTEKYNQKRIDAETKIYDKIKKLTDQSFTASSGDSRKATRQIESELAKRLKAITEYFDQIRKLNKDNPAAVVATYEAEYQAKKGAKGKAKAAEGVEVDLDRAFRSSISRFSRDFYRTLTSIGTQADQTFKGVFSSLTQGLNSSLNEVFLSQFNKILEDAFKNIGNALSKTQQQLIAAAGLAGGIISGATPKTSYLGQAAGGALSGAATGALTGAALGSTTFPVVGTAIGAALGALGGIFGASAERKRQRLEEEALAEQKKQTALMERQNALAYLGNIVGKMVSGVGVITGLDINSQGRLETTITGQQINLVLERYQKGRK